MKITYYAPDAALDMTEDEGDQYRQWSAAQIEQWYPFDDVEVLASGSTIEISADDEDQERGVIGLCDDLPYYYANEIQEFEEVAAARTFTIPDDHAKTLIDSLYICALPKVTANQMQSQLEKSGSLHDVLNLYGITIQEQMIVHGRTAYLITTNRGYIEMWYVMDRGWLDAPDGSSELEYLYKVMTYDKKSRHDTTFGWESE